jgi:D-alanine-D-alanine ligase-like ATP-grasp enzyme
MKHCKDCEPAQEIHWVAYSSVVLGWISEPFFDFAEKCFGRLAKVLLNLSPIPFFKFMNACGLAHFTYRPSEEDNLRTKCVWDEAKRRNIKMYEFNMGPIRDMFVAEFNGKTISFDGLPGLDTETSGSLKWMDDKGIMKEKFKKEGLPVADGGTAFTFRKALKIFNQLEKPVITKPNLGSRSRHTMIHLNTVEDLKIGFDKAKKLSPFVVVEEELDGYLFRGTVINKQLVGVVRRDQPEVVGDGVRTLRQLFEEENARKERNGPIFHKIPLDKEEEAELKRQNITMDDIPERGRVVTFSQKTSRSCGGTTSEVTDQIHAENKAILEHVAKFLNTNIVGIDFIMPDISKPWTEQKRTGIIECNSLPFIDLHHYPLFGEENNVAGKLWDMVFPESKMSD